MSIFDVIAENKIQEAIQRGEFDHLPFHGQPLDLYEDFSISAQARFLIRRLQAAAGAGREPSALAIRWKAMRYQQRNLASYETNLRSRDE